MDEPDNTLPPGVTPGEWAVEIRGDDPLHPLYCVMSRTEDGEKYCVAKVRHEPDSQEFLPNARLMAAAPDLLRALEVMVASFAGAMGLGEDDRDDDGFEYDCITQAREAIRTAREGR